MASDRRCIQPVFGVRNRKASSEILDSAESLVDNLDALADVLDRLAEKYNIESKYTTSDTENAGDGALIPENSSDHSLFSKMKAGLDSAKLLIGCLKREKRRLTKRQQSVECRIGEIEDYKQHMKNDLSSLNEMVDLLSIRVVQLESKLCEEQEAYENLTAEKTDLEERLQQLELQTNTDSESKPESVSETESDTLKTNSTLALENKELKYKVEILVVENRKLKDMVRRKFSVVDTDQESDLGTPTSSVSETSEDSCNNNNRMCVSVSDESDF